MRELENTIENLIVIAENNTISEEDVRTALLKNDKKECIVENLEITGTIDEMVKAYEAEILSKVYEEYGNTEKMAEVLGTTRSTINRKIAKYGIR